MTTSSVIYSHGLDRIVLPIEMLLWQGHQLDVVVPGTMSQRSLRSLAGEGMTLPCLASIVHVLQLMGGFNVSATSAMVP